MLDHERILARLDALERYLELGRLPR